MTLALPDEAPPASHGDDARRARLIAPHLFPVEVANARSTAVRRRRLDAPEDADEVCRTIESLQVEIVARPHADGRGYYARLALRARAHRLRRPLSSMLAQREGIGRCPLATADMIAASQAARLRVAGVEVLS